MRPTTHKRLNQQAPQPTSPHCPNPNTQKSIHDDNDEGDIEIDDLMDGDTVVGIGESLVSSRRHSRIDGWREGI
jgi:hypothetical protein